jgi:chromosome segregation ATPase
VKGNSANTLKEEIAEIESRLAELDKERASLDERLQSLQAKLREALSNDQQKKTVSFFRLRKRFISSVIFSEVEKMSILSSGLVRRQEQRGTVLFALKSGNQAYEESRR